jgi:type IV secretion system protein VirD4
LLGRKFGITVLLLFFIAADIFILPLILKFPEFLIVNPVGAVTGWTDFIRLNPLIGPILLLEGGKFFRLWLYMQPIVFAGFFWLLWQPGIRKRRNRISDGVGGPEAAEYSIVHGSSRWQTKKEIDRNTTPWQVDRVPEKGGIVLGFDPDRRKAWLETNDLHTLIIGATRSGKTRRLILPTIWQLAKAGESMILTDPKGELCYRSRDYLKKQGYNIILLDFRNPRRGNYWNPIFPVIQAVSREDYSKASEAAWDIAHMIVWQKEHTGDPLWPNGEESVIAAMILLTALEAPEEKLKHMGTAYSILYSLGAADEGGTLPLNDYVTELPVGHPAKAAYGTALLAPYRTRASFFTGASADLRLWADPSIVHLTSKQDHSLDMPGKKKTAVFLVIPDEKSTRHVLASLYIDQTYSALIGLATESGGRLPIRVNFLLDEFGNLPSINDFDKKLTVAAGRGIRFVLVTQDIAQLKRHYRESAQTITGNCHTWIYLLTADVETARLISAKTGQYTVETDSYSSQVRTDAATTGVNYSTTGRALLLPDEVMRWPQDMSLVLQARNFPMKLPLPDLSKWPADRELVPGAPEQDRDIELPEVWVPEVKQGGEEIEEKMRDEKTEPEADIMDLI